MVAVKTACGRLQDSARSPREGKSNESLFQIQRHNCIGLA